MLQTELSTERKAELAQIDTSTKGPVLFFFAASVFWLVLGTLAGILVSIKMHNPSFLSDGAWLSFGRLRPAHLNMVIYGWAIPAGFGVALWLIARLSRIELKLPEVLITAGIFWNVGIVLGVFGILLGHSAAIPWLEFPKYAVFILFIAYSIIGIWAVLMFLGRKPGNIYVSGWYLIAAFLWFPWLYGAATLMVNILPVQGVMQAVVASWYSQGLFSLWFVPIGLGIAYYLVPKITGRPIQNYFAALIGFWSLALFSTWTGMIPLIGGPIPAWMITVSIIAGVMMLLPITIIALNFKDAWKEMSGEAKHSPALRFVLFGVACYLAVSLQNVLMSFRSVNLLGHFTHYTVGLTHLGLLGFYSMVLFGAIYYITPRLTGREWPNIKLIRMHYSSLSLGIIMMFTVLAIGGLIQGFELLSASTSFVDVMKHTKVWLVLRSVSGILLTAGNIAFGILFVLMLLGRGKSLKGVS
jgi:cytochrome c oxidase cbb3-type subunit 1